MRSVLQHLIETIVDDELYRQRADSFEEILSMLPPNMRSTPWATADEFTTIIRHDRSSLRLFSDKTKNEASEALMDEIVDFLVDELGYTVKSFGAKNMRTLTRERVSVYLTARTTSSLDTISDVSSKKRASIRDAGVNLHVNVSY